MPSPKMKMSWKDWRGNPKTYEINLVADARAVEGLAGYPWIIMAANPQLSNVLIEQYLQCCGISGVERSLSWIQRRRWMFRNVAEGNAKGPQTDLDGNAARAVSIMRDNPKLSLRDMARLLKEHRIVRSREWIRQHRCDGV